MTMSTREDLEGHRRGLHRRGAPFPAIFFAGDGPPQKTSPVGPRLLASEGGVRSDRRVVRGLGGVMRWGTLGLLWVMLGCGVVGKGPDPDAVVDMSRAGDLSVAPACSVKNCAGCCLGDVCQPGVKASACGAGGGACVVCTDAQLCGADSQCAFDPSANWLVAVTQAQILTTNPQTGMQWRADGTMPQPFVQFDTNNRTGTVAIVVAGTPPVWTASWGTGFVYAAKDLVSTGVKLQMFDQPSGVAAQPMTAVHTITLSQQDFAAKNLTYQGWEGAKTLSISLQRR